MIGVCKQPITALYFEFENELKFYNLKARSKGGHYGSRLIDRCDITILKQLLPTAADLFNAYS